MSPIQILPDDRSEVIDHDIRGNPITRGDVTAIRSPQAPDTPVADCGPNPVTWSEEDKHRLDAALNKMYGTPLPAAPAAPAPTCANAGPPPGDMPIDRAIAALPLPQYPVAAPLPAPSWNGKKLHTQ